MPANWFYSDEKKEYICSKNQPRFSSLFLFFVFIGILNRVCLDNMMEMGCTMNMHVYMRSVGTCLFKLVYFKADELSLIMLKDSDRVLSGSKQITAYEYGGL